MVLALIPARAGSKGIPGKNTRPLGGRPLLAYSVDAARQSQEITRVVVSTDDEAIARVARAHGADVPFIRPKTLAADDTPMADVVCHVLSELRTRCENPEIVVLLQPTVPFRVPSEIDEAVRTLRGSAADAVVTVSPVPPQYHPDWQFVIVNGVLQKRDGDVAAMPRRRQDLSQTYFRNGSLYVFKADAFFRTGSIYGNRTIPIVMAGEAPVNIDTADDWGRAEQRLRRHGISV